MEAATRVETVMIDIAKGDVLRDGGCMECPAHEDREVEIVRFWIGSFGIRLCPDHAHELDRSLRQYLSRRTA